MSERSQFALLGQRRFVPFRKIGLAAGAPLPPAKVNPEVLQSTVLALRGEWR